MTESTDKKEGLFENRDFINMLAGVGAGLDPKGLGGAMGNTAMSINQSQAMAEAQAKQQKRQDSMFASLIQALSGNSNLTGLEYDENGNLKKITGAAGDPNGGKPGANGTVAKTPETASYENELDQGNELANAGL